MEEWKEYKLNDVATLSTGFPFDGHKYAKEGIRVVRGDNVTIGSLRWDTDKDKRWNEPFNRASEYSLRSDDIVIGMDGSRVGKNRAQIKQEDLPLYIAQRVACIRHNDLSLQSFLYYQIFSQDFENYIKAVQTGTSIPHVSLKQIGDFPVMLPSLKVQQKIADILKTLDKKIEVNRKLNDNLQHQAEALFKSFFVDFKLFRGGEFIKTELGLIPKNWKILLFGDFIVALTEKAPVDSLPEYSVTNNGIIPRDTKFNKKLSKSSSMNKVLRKNNLVFGMSREILNWGIMEDEIGGVSSAYNIYKIDEDLVDPTYLRLYMKAKIAEFNSLIGTAAREGQSLDKGQLMQKKIYVPTKDVLQDFFAHYVPIMKSIHNSEQESSHLAQLRDALLLKLMSGELKIS
jgi:type I restriction enzyme S subunit